MKPDRTPANPSYKMIFIPGSIFLGVIIALFLAEIITRLFFYIPIGRTVVKNEFIRSDIPGVGYELRPNHSYQYRYGPARWLAKPLAVPVRINEHGLRGASFEVKKLPETYRILAIGDSFTMGMGIEEDATFTRLIEIGLQKTAPDNIKVEVLNAGVPGYNLIQEYHWLIVKGLSFDPDILIWGFNTNDAGITNQYAVNSEGLLIGAGAALKKRQQSSHETALVVEKERSFQEMLKDECQLYRQFLNWQNPFTVGPPLKRSELAILEPYLPKLASICQDKSIPLLLLVFPESPKSKPVQSKMLDWIHLQCLNAKIPFIDFYPLVQDIPLSQYQVHPCDPHPGAEANKLFADVILSKIKWIEGDMVIQSFQ